MNAREIVKAILNEKGMSKRHVAQILKLSPQTMNNRLNKRGMQVDKLIEVLNVLDCRLVIMPKSSRLPKDSYEVTVEE